MSRQRNIRSSRKKLFNFLNDEGGIPIEEACIVSLDDNTQIVDGVKESSIGDDSRLPVAGGYIQGDGTSHFTTNFSLGGDYFKFSDTWEKATGAKIFMGQGVSSNYATQVYWQNNNNFYVFVGTGTGFAYEIFSGASYLDQKVAVEVIYDGLDSDKIKLCLNGILQTPTTVSGTMPASLQTASNFYFLKLLDGGTYGIGGKITHPTFYNRAGEVLHEFLCEETTGLYLIDKVTGELATLTGTVSSVRGLDHFIYSHFNEYGGIIAPYWNGTTSKIDTNLDLRDLDLTGNITISVCIDPFTYGGGLFGTTGSILNNGEIYFENRLSGGGITKALMFSSNASTVTSSADNSIILNKKYNVIVTRNAAGDKTNFYINGVLSGTADQDSGTPVASSTDLIIGNNASGSRAFDGLIGNVTIYSGINTVNPTDLTTLTKIYETNSLDFSDNISETTATVTDLGSLYIPSGVSSTIGVGYTDKVKYRVTLHASETNQNRITTSETVTGSFTGLTITETFGTAVLEVSGSSIICTTGGTVIGRITLSDGSWCIVDGSEFLFFSDDKIGTKNGTWAIGQDDAYAYIKLNDNVDSWYETATPANIVYVPAETTVHASYTYIANYPATTKDLQLVGVGYKMDTRGTLQYYNLPLVTCNGVLGFPFVVATGLAQMLTVDVLVNNQGSENQWFAKVCNNTTPLILGYSSSALTELQSQEVYGELLCGGVDYFVTEEGFWIDDDGELVTY